MSTYFEEHLSVNDCLWGGGGGYSTGAIKLVWKKSPPEGFCILMNVYILFKFSTLGSVSQHGTLQQIISNASSLFLTQLA